MNGKELANFLATVDAVLEAVPGLVEDRHIRNLRRLRGIFELVLQIKNNP